MLLYCYGEKLQHVHVELLLSYSDKSAFAGVNLHNHYVAHHVIVDLLVVAYMQLVVRLPLDLRWSLVKDVALVLGMLELVDDTALAEWKAVLVEPCLLSRPQC